MIRSQRQLVPSEESIREVEKAKDFRTETILAYDDEEFSRHFRMERTTFNELLRRLAPRLPERYEGFGERIIPPDERLYMVLWFLATNESYRALACRFGTSDSTVHESVDIVVSAIVEELANEVKFPTTEEECKLLSSEFQQRNGFPNIIGAIDGTHIKISKPSREPDVWVDRQGNHSIGIAAVVDQHRRFTYYSIGCPGSMHDQRVYRLSSIEELLNPISDHYHLIGDSAYTLATKMMVPYKDNGKLTARQKSFNYRHSSNRMAVENSFGLLKNKFSRIHSLLIVHSWRRAVAIIKACLHLHNFIINNENVTEPAELFEAVILPSDPKDKRDAIAAIVE